MHVSNLAPEVGDRSRFKRRRAAVLFLRVAGLVLAGSSLLGCEGLLQRLGPQGASQLVGKNEHYAVVRVSADETYAGLAARFLGDPAMAPLVADANGGASLVAGERAIISLKPENPVGVYREGYQVVPILSYHRFNRKGGRLAVSPEQFEQQLGYLQANNYRVVPLTAVSAFLRGEGVLPRRAVVITIDDGYRSTYSTAYPILARFGFSATLFVYTDYVGRGGLTWAQLAEMSESGVMSIQPHSKTHANLTLQVADETRAQYTQRVLQELSVPRELLKNKLSVDSVSFAYPFGATNTLVVDALQRTSYALGLTVKRGANAFFAHPFALQRTMVFGDVPASRFGDALQVFVPNGGFKEQPVVRGLTDTQAVSRALELEADDDLARALKQWRVLDAMNASPRTGEHLIRLERIIAEKAQNLLVQARDAQSRGLVQRAREHLLRALAYDPHNGDARELLQSSEYRLSQAALAKRPGKSPSKPAADEVERAKHANGGGASDTDKHLDRAEASAHKAAPKLEVAERLYREGVRLFSSELDESIVAFEEALSLNPDHEKARVYLASARKLKAARR